MLDTLRDFDKFCEKISGKLPKIIHPIQIVCFHTILLLTQDQP